MMSKRFWIVATVAMAVVASGLRAGEVVKGGYTLRVAADRADATSYKVGERVGFVVTLLRDGKPCAGEVACEIVADSGAVLASQKLMLKGKPGELAVKIDKPLVLRCKASFKVEAETLSVLSGAAVEPLKIQPSQPAPADFDAFWADQKKKLAAVKMEVKMTPVEVKGNIECFDVEVTCLGDKPVRAYLARPKNAKPKSLPAVLWVHSASITASSQQGAVNGAVNFGALSMDLGAHGLLNGQPPEYYTELGKKEMSDYQTRGIDSPGTYYFLGMYLRLVRALDFLTSQPEWDGQVLLVTGSSQGGGQAVVAAGLDSRVTVISASVPAFCDLTGRLFGRPSGWPGRVTVDAAGKPTNPKAAETVRYFDAVNFAARAKAQARIAVGLIDGTCPPTGVYAMFNNYAGAKTIKPYADGGHSLGPAAGGEGWKFMGEVLKKK